MKTRVKDLHLSANYLPGFAMPENFVFKAANGLSRKIIEEISSHKKEPEWMLQWRLQAWKTFLAKPLPAWGGDLADINFDDLCYYLKPEDRVRQSWNDLPKDIKTTFDRLGIPEAERQYLQGVSAQYDSEVIYHSLQKTLTKQGVIFLDTDTALKKYPDLFREYFGTVVPPADNKFSALNSACWSGGSFVFVPRGVKVELPLQAYFRINAQNMGQFERTLIVAEEGSSVHYVEGCFTKGTQITTKKNRLSIEAVKVGDAVLTHKGRYRYVYKTQKRLYTGNLYKIKVWGDATQVLNVTEEHPFLAVRRQNRNERNRVWNNEWLTPKNLKKGDYLMMPVDRTINSFRKRWVTIPIGRGRHGYKNFLVPVPSTKAFFRLAGYYLSEGSVSSGHYVNFSFHENERVYIEEVKSLIREVFRENKFREVPYKKNHGVSIVVNSTLLARMFSGFFGKNASERKIPNWMLFEEPTKQKELIETFFNGDGNYYNKQFAYGLKEIFRLCTISETLAYQLRNILLRLDIVASLNCQKNRGKGRRPIYNVCISGEQAARFGSIVGQSVKPKLNLKKRATMFYLDGKYAYLPIRRVTKRRVTNKPVYNFSVNGDETYVAGGLAVHNCSAPSFSTNSLHSAVVEIIIKPGARVRYTTVQNWYKNVYNLVTKRAYVYEDGEMSWIDANLGSRVTMKFPSVVLLGRGARGSVLSLAVAGAGQHQDSGGKAIHAAPHTSSTITAKSISHDGGRSSYRGLVKVLPDAKNSKSHVVCDALLLDEESRSDTYPMMDIKNDAVEIGHEATVSKIGEEQLFYLMSRGLAETAARSLIVNGFLEPIAAELPMEYAVELNRLIGLEMEGSVG